MRQFVLLVSGLTVLAAGPVVAQQNGGGADRDQDRRQTAADVKSWLDRMNTAVEELNYRGTFVHSVDGDVEAEVLHIVHRNADGVVSERISARDGGSEVLRTERGVRSVLPKQRLVLLEEPRRSSTPLDASRMRYSDNIELYYDVATFPSRRGQIAGRDAQVVSIRPKDEFRYGYFLWLDRETALPLRSQVLDEDGDVVEQIVFTDLEVVDSIDESEVQPVIDTEGFEVRRPRPDARSDLDEQWRAKNVPIGFYLSEDRESMLAGSTYPVRHLVYSDGLATVSVYISHPLSTVDMDQGFSRMGSTNAYSLRVDGRLATAMGDVPRRTVQRIATSLDAR
ncbi:MAG: MucB/RseB C-terminal domain-containing protein [Gammaproteobacteria bacterium]|nr:MucB/RseB C-terminal domain-containing protein [Gammaproteobacteria bacterium]